MVFTCICSYLGVVGLAMRVSGGQHQKSLNAKHAETTSAVQRGLWPADPHAVAAAAAAAAAASKAAAAPHKAAAEHHH